MVYKPHKLFPIILLATWTGIYPCISQNQKEANPKLVQMLNYFNNGNYTKSILLALEHLEEDSEDHYVRILLAKAYMAQKSWDKARKLLTELIFTIPDHDNALLLLGEIFYAQQKYKEATSYFVKYLRLKPQSDIVRFKLFLAYLLSSQEAKALKTVEKINLQDLDTPDKYIIAAAWNYHNRHLARGDYFVQAALRIYTTQNLAPYLNRFVELGWISHSFY